MQNIALLFIKKKNEKNQRFANLVLNFTYLLTVVSFDFLYIIV